MDPYVNESVNAMQARGVVRASVGITEGVGLYTILQSPILYGVCVWHTQEGSAVGGRILRNVGCAIVLQ